MNDLTKKNNITKAKSYKIYNLSNLVLNFLNARIHIQSLC